MPDHRPNDGSRRHAGSAPDIPKRTHARYYYKTQLREAIARLIATHVCPSPEMVVVDFGCGEMPYRSLFPSQAEYIGVDLARNEQAQVTVGDDGRATLPDGSANVVLSTQVLEHHESPDAYLRECHRLLKPGGALVLSTHGYWRYHPDPVDYWRWTRAGLVKTISERGFTVVAMADVLGLGATAMQLLQDAWSERVSPWLRPLFQASMQVLIEATDRILDRTPAPRDDAAVFVVVARK